MIPTAHALPSTRQVTGEASGYASAIDRALTPVLLLARTDALLNFDWSDLIDMDGSNG